MATLPRRQEAVRRRAGSAAAQAALRGGTPSSALSAARCSHLTPLGTTSASWIGTRGGPRSGRKTATSEAGLREGRAGQIDGRSTRERGFRPRRNRGNEGRGQGKGREGSEVGVERQGMKELEGLGCRGARREGWNLWERDGHKGRTSREGVWSKNFKLG